MDFKENINESYEMEYQEVGETGDPVLIIKDIDNDVEHRFYPEDLIKLTDFLSYIKKFSSLTLERDVNESYNLRYVSIAELGDPIVVLEDLDNNEKHTFYPEDIQKIEEFLNRLKKFGVIKSNEEYSSHEKHLIKEYLSTNI